MNATIERLSTKSSLQEIGREPFNRLIPALFYIISNYPKHFIWFTFSHLKKHNKNPKVFDEQQN
jgi:hypothetical protein